MTTKQKHKFAMAASLAIALVLTLWLWHNEPQRFNNGYGANPSKNSEVSKTVPQIPPNSAVGTPEWERWYEALSPNDRLVYLEKLDESYYPASPGDGDWKNVSVSKGPGTGKSDVLRCKVLSNYKPLLQPSQRIGVMALQFHNTRDKNSMLTYIWATNAKKAIVVDWETEAVMPAVSELMHNGSGLCPQIIQNGYLVMDNDGKIALTINNKGKSFPWKEGFAAYPLLLSSESPLAFAVAWNDQGKILDSAVCFSMNPINLLGDIKLPESTSTVWMQFDKSCNMLLIVDHDWKWISMIDCASLKNDK